MIFPEPSRTGETRERRRCPGFLPLISSYSARPVSSLTERAQNCGMAPVSFAQPKTSEHRRPMICSSGTPIMSAKALLANTMRESSDCTQTPSSIASNSVSRVGSAAHSPACDDGKTRSGDSSFVVIFYRACQAPSLRVSSIRFLPSNSLASDASQDRSFETHYEISALTHGIGIFPQSVGNIPHRKGLSAGLEPFPVVIDFVGL